MRSQETEKESLQGLHDVWCEGHRSIVIHLSQAPYFGNRHKTWCFPQWLLTFCVKNMSLFAFKHIWQDLLSSTNQPGLTTLKRWFASTNRHDMVYNFWKRVQGFCISMITKDTTMTTITLCFKQLDLHTNTLFFARHANQHLQGYTDIHESLQSIWTHSLCVISY